MRLNRRSPAVLTAASLAVLGVALAFAQPNPNVMVGKAAPAFSAPGSDGKTHTLDSLTAGGDTVILYFISETCPVNAEALPHFKKIGAAHKNNSKAKLIGVFNGTKAEFDAWNKTNKVTFTTLFDPELEIIRSYRAAFSPWSLVVDPDKKISRSWAGYSKASLQNLNALMAQKGGIKTPTLTYPGAPAEMSGG